MATPADPNKALRTAQQQIDAAQRVKDGQTATVKNGQVIDGFTLTVAGGVVTSIDPVV